MLQLFAILFGGIFNAAVVPNMPYVTGSAKRGLIAFLNLQLQKVTTHSVFTLLM